MAVNILGKFLQHNDNNMRYVALNSLAKIATTELQVRHVTTSRGKADIWNDCRGVCYMTSSHVCLCPCRLALIW